jgi:2,4-dienoyl-CoA reductase-like NADH-dependent reductase (Old Yellow Enzyme family)/NADPH-dependent 2,4-dienoyl-CoA reductase/sulfur reductase-like enzyme
MASTYSKYTNVFSPIKVNGVDFKNRIILAPPSPNLASPDGLVTHQYVDWMRMFARGGAAILYVGNSSIDITECKDEECQFDLVSDRCILPLSWYAEMALEFDCHASLEVNHNGKDTTFEAVGHLPFSSSAIPGDSEKMRAMREGREPRIPIEMDQAKIDETVMKYALACQRMQRAGMDVALLHGGHGNLLAQFTSPHYNKRTDKYGGSVENRARFAIEVVEKTRELCGPNFVIDYRISADEIIPDGMHFEETLQLMKILRDHGVDMFNVSAGLHSEGMMAYMSYWLQGYTQKRGFNVHWAEKIKDYFQGDIRLTAVGSINNIDLAEEILANGWADFIAMCRPLMADPEMPRKAAQNRPEDIRPCLRCNACAQRLGGPGPNGPKEMNCAINPLLGLTRLIKDGQVPLARTKKKVAVVGAGPAGLTALFALVERGHDVTLYEKSDRVGGQIIPAAAPPIKFDMKDYLTWLEVQTQKIVKSGKAKVLLNTEATAGLLEVEGYDALVIAVGSEPIVPKSIPGITKPSVMWAADAETKYKSKVGKKVVVIGAGDVGIEAALDFAEDGKEVEIIDIMPKPLFMMNNLAGMLAEKGVEIQYNTSLSEVTDTGIIVKDTDGKTREIKADNVLLAMGVKPLTAVVESLRRAAPETEVYVVGDAKAVGGNITMAVNPAFQAAIHI